jgi:hypothetical protein
MNVWLDNPQYPIGFLCAVVAAGIAMIVLNRIRPSYSLGERIVILYFVFWASFGMASTFVSDYERTIYGPPLPGGIRSMIPRTLAGSVVGIMMARVFVALRSGSGWSGLCPFSGH